MAHDEDDPADDALAGIDLAAWQPPAPPADLADAVIARLREPPSVVAIDPEPPPPSRRAHIALIAGAIALSAGTATGIAWWGTTRAPGPRSGVVLASGPQHLVLDDTTADLDPGAELRWMRDGHRLTVHQLRGTARWTIAGDDSLRLDAAPDLHPGGTDSTAIEASGASLRVEVPMNLADLKIVGMTTGIAAVAAVITVAVYQGHIAATSGGQTVRIEPGATVELRPHQQPAPPAPAPVATVEREPVAVTPLTLDPLRLTGEKNILPDAITMEALALTGEPVMGSFRFCLDTTGHVASVVRLRSTRFDSYDATIERTIQKTWTYRPYVVNGVAVPACTNVTFIYTSKEGSRLNPCDESQFDDNITQAANQYNSGYAAEALATMRTALSCKQEVRLYRLAGLYACAAHDADSAHEYIAKIPVEYRPAIEQKCAAEGVSL